MFTDPTQTLDSRESLLSAVGSWTDESQDRERWTFLSAAKFADLHSPESRPQRGRTLPGMERGVQLGGEGTPLVNEFAAADFGAMIGKGTWAGRRMIANALDVRERLPRLWAGVRAGDVRVYLAERVAEQTRHLSREAAGFVDAEVAEYADGRLTWTRFLSLLEGKVVAADPETAARREAEKAERQFAKATRSSEHGTKGFYLRASTAVIIRFEATVSYLADALRALGDGDTEDLRRVKACLIMANPAHAVELLQAFATHRASGDSPNDWGDGPDAGNSPHDPGDEPLDDAPEPEPGSEAEPGSEPSGESCPECGAARGNPVTTPRPFRPGDIPPNLPSNGPSDGSGNRPSKPFAYPWSKLLPRVSMHLHLSQDTIIRDRGGVVRWDGEGPITLQYVREQIAPYHRVDIHPVIDLENQAPVDGYEIPTRHRRAVRLMTPAEVFPFSSHMSAGADVDHTSAYASMDEGGPPGQSRVGNYGPLVRFHHRIKTFGDWKVRQPFPGIYIWRSPYAEHFLVDHTGTRRLGSSGSGARKDRHNPNLEVQVSTHPDPVEYEYSHSA